MRRRTLLALPAAAAVAGPAGAAAFPERAITTIVPFGPGGGGDIAARTVGRFMEQRLGQPVVVVNRPGAAGEIRFAAIRRAAPDGYTIGVVTTPNLVTIPIERRAQYQLSELAPIANLVDDVGGVFVRADSPFRDVRDLVGHARAHPGAVSYGTTGIGTYAHFSALALQRIAGVTLNPVAYTGTALIRRALMGGELMAAGISITDGAEDARNGLLRPLGQTAPERWSGAPAVPTLREQGFDVVAGSMRGFAAPAGTPPEALRALGDAIRAATEAAEFRRMAEQQAMPLRYMDAAAFAAELARQDAQYRRLWQEHPWRE
jgi:tripartite-type tricarboxylate transporter receptor subunit TctC